MRGLWIRFVLRWAWFAMAAASVAAGDFEARLGRMEATAKAEPKNASIRFEIGRMLHWEGSLGRKEVGDPAVKWLREVLKLQPTNAFARALIGSSMTLQARDASFPPNRLRLAKAGIAEMDAAVRAAPEDPNVRFTRASNNLYLPALFKRADVVKADFAWLDERVRRQAAELGTEFCQWTFCFHGLAKKKMGDPAAAAALWTEGVKLDPKSDAARRMRKECRCDLP